MLWRTLTPQDVKDRMADDEVDTYQETAAGEDAPDRMPKIIDQVVERFRGAIRANPQVSAIGPDGTIPKFLIFSAAVIARAALIGMPPTREGVTDPRTKENNIAEDELKAVRTMNGAAFALYENPPETSTSFCAFGGDKRLGF